MAQNKPALLNVVVKGQVSATSNKVDNRFKNEDPTKTAYLIVNDPAEAQKLIDFGLTQYSSKTDDTKFFIVKLPKEVAIYIKGADGNAPEKYSGRLDSPNFSTAEGKDLNLNIIQGENTGNKFFRLQAIQIEETSDFIEVQQTNPFA